MRSFLFVPADSERKLAKGPASGADGLILDLEDSVATDRKKVARGMALAYLNGADRSGPKLYVRVNALDTGLTLADLATVMQGRPDGIVFPKCVGQADLGALAKGPAPGVYDDTFKLARTVNLMASVAAGVTAYDTVYPDIRNVEGLRAEAHDARRMGYGGKIAIHPDQVAIIHEIFTPTDTEIDWARRVIATFEGNPGAGVLTMDGKMLDKPHLVLARRLVSRTGG